MSDIKSILLHVDATPESVGRLEIARALALRHDARITALFGAAWESERSSFAYSAGAAIQALENDTRELARDEARAQLQRGAARIDPEVAWCEVAGDSVTHAFLGEAVYADLLVVGQQSQEPIAGAAPHGFVESAILASGRPTLILPPQFNEEVVGECVLVAWDGSTPASRAVRGALPFLRRAESVHVVSWARQPLVASFSRIDLGEFLLRHGIAATVHHRDSSSRVAAELEAFSAELNADLVVMGCYGHSRASERIFGGTSRSTLTASRIPLLMMH